MKYETRQNSPEIIHQTFFVARNLDNLAAITALKLAINAIDLDWYFWKRQYLKLIDVQTHEVEPGILWVCLTMVPLLQMTDDHVDDIGNIVSQLTRSTTKPKGRK